MTKSEQERLAILETKVDTIVEGQKESTKKIDHIEEKLDEFIQAADKRFVTRGEAKAIGAVGGLVIALLGILLRV